MPDSPPRLPDDLRDALADTPEAERNALANIWHLLDADEDTPDTDSAWASLRAGLPQASLRTAPDRDPARHPASRPGLWRRARLVVAPAVLAAAALATWWLSPVTHRASPGEQFAVVLPDGSEVTLASGAEIRHARRFNGTREVDLTGEAFFEVQSAAEPFVVSTHDATVTVLGTAFNVRAWGQATHVALVHGSVRVGARGQAVVLAPGETVTTEGATLNAREADVDRASLWREGGLSFDGEPLGDVLRDVERRYGVEIAVGADAPTDERVSALYASRPVLDTLLGDLGAATGSRFVRTARGFEARAAGTED